LLLTPYNEYYNESVEKSKALSYRNFLYKLPSVLNYLNKQKELVYADENIKVYSYKFFKDFIDFYLKDLLLGEKRDFCELYKEINRIIRGADKEILSKIVKDEKLKRDSYLYQYLASISLKFVDSLFLFYEMGLGKSKVIADAINLNEKINKVLIVVPAHLLIEMKKKIEEDLKRDLKIKIIRPSLYVGIDNKERYKRVLEELLTEGNVIHIISYQYLGKVIQRNKENKELLDKIIDRVKVFDLAVFDEAHYFKNEKSLNFEAVKTINLLSERRIVSTGTPYAREIKDTLNLIENPLKRIEYKEEGQEKIYEVIKKIGLFLKTDAVHNLPPLHIKEVKVYANKELKRVYDKITKENEYENKVQKLLQLNSFFLYKNDGTYEKFGEEKIKELIKLIRERFSKEQIVVIWYLYKAEEEELSKWLRKEFKNHRVVVLERDYENGVDLSNYVKGQKTILLLQIQKFAEGLNLQEYGINKMIFYNLTYDYVKYKQAIKRIHRIGQNKECYVYFLNTYVDGRAITSVVSNLAFKEKQAEKLFEREELNEKIDVDALLEKVHKEDLIDTNISEWKFSTSIKNFKEALCFYEEKVLKEIAELTKKLNNGEIFLETYLNELENRYGKYVGIYLSPAKWKVAKSALIRHANCMKYRGFAYEINEKEDDYEIVRRKILPYRCNTVICGKCQSYNGKRVRTENLAFFDTEIVKKHGSSFLTLTYKRIPYERVISELERFNQVWNALMEYKITYNELPQFLYEGLIELNKHYQNVIDLIKRDKKLFQEQKEKRIKMKRKEFIKAKKGYKELIKVIKSELEERVVIKDYKDEIIQYFKKYPMILHALKDLVENENITIEDINFFEKEEKKRKLRLKVSKAEKKQCLEDIEANLRRIYSKYYQCQIGIFRGSVDKSKFVNEIKNYLMSFYKGKVKKERREVALVYSVVSDIVESLKVRYVAKSGIKSDIFAYLFGKDLESIKKEYVKKEYPYIRLTEIFQGIYRMEMTYDEKKNSYHPHIHALITNPYIKSRYAKYLLIVIAKRCGFGEILHMEEINDKEKMAEYGVASYDEGTIEVGPHKFVIAYCLAYMKKVRKVGKEFREQWQKAYLNRLLKELSDYYVYLFDESKIKFEYDRISLFAMPHKVGEKLRNVSMCYEINKKVKITLKGDIEVDKDGNLVFRPYSDYTGKYESYMMYLDRYVLEKFKQALSKECYSDRSTIYLKEEKMLIVNKKKAIERLFNKSLMEELGIEHDYNECDVKSLKITDDIIEEIL